MTSAFTVFCNHKVACVKRVLWSDRPMTPAAIEELKQRCRDEWAALGAPGQAAWKRIAAGKSAALPQPQEDSVAVAPQEGGPSPEPRWCDRGAAEAALPVETISDYLQQNPFEARRRLAEHDPALWVHSATPRASTLPEGAAVQHSMWGCFASKKVCRAVLTRSRLLAVNDISGRLTDWVDSLGKDAASACQALACLRGVHRPSGERLDVVLLLVMARQRWPKLQFFARCSVPENEDVPGQDVIPDSFPFVASLRVGPSVISPAYSSVKIVTNETLAEELAEFDMAWKLHPLRWDFPADSHRLTDHAVTGIGAAFIPPQGKKRKASRVEPTAADIPDGDPLELGEVAAAAGRSSVDCPVLGAPPRGVGAPAADFMDVPSEFIDLDMEDLFFGLDQDAREAIASEWFGHEGCIDDSLLHEEEEAAGEHGDDASDGSKEFDDLPACLEDDGDAAAAAESEGAGGGAAAGESEDAAPAAATGEPSLDDFVPPRGCTLSYFAHQTRPGQSFWQAKIPKGAPPFEGTKSRTHKFSNDDPVERAAARAFCAGWLQRWMARGSSSGGGGGSASGGGGGAGA